MLDAEEKGYAIGAFNACNYESLTAVIEAAEEMGIGVILNHAEVHFPLMPLEEIAPIMVEHAKKAKVPVCVHLDHGESIETCMKAIQLGFTSVMLDASADDYETNVKNTALICRLAHSVGVTVEA
jgi:fructose-bisphosphate aldolase class II